jgi:addiction module RelE/StbE family toxin
MWQVYEHEDIDKIAKKLPREILVKYEKWKDIVKLSGPKGLMVIKGFRDEKLKGVWANFRSSRLNLQYRVIYQVESDRLIVKVIRVTPHDYRR